MEVVYMGVSVGFKGHKHFAECAEIEKLRSKVV